jgi:hypothetical protein
MDLSIYELDIFPRDFGPAAKRATARPAGTHRVPSEVVYGCE